MSQEEDEVLKIIILGEGRAGKTEILSKYFSQFNEGKKNTISPSFYQIKKEYQGKRVNLNFYDAMGSEQFNIINTMHYQNAAGALLIYNAAIFETFEKVKDWVHTQREAVGNDIILVIAGNNFDLCDKNEIDKNEEKIKDYCTQHNCQHFYNSSRNGFNLNETFESLISSASKKNIGNNNVGINKKGKRFNIKDETKRKKGKGCI